MSTTSASGFGIYLHWPFCSAKCPYCDFNSHVRHGRIDEERYTRGFVQELRTLSQRSGPREVSSIFFGGGTPSLMQPQTLATILDEVAQLWHVAADVEITLEANPGSADAGRFRGYRSAGVNRLSLGVQALNDTDLKFLGRLHDTEEALAAIELARSTFPRLSFDLIYARPGQQPTDWVAELELAMERAADHLSLYQLTIEQGTPFHALYCAGKLRPPADEAAATLFEVTQEITDQRGLPAYEVSNHAVPGAESRHNLVYWRYGEYVGAGPGAHGRFIENGQRIVTIAERLPEAWLERVEACGHGIVDGEVLTRAEEADEMLMMGLRLFEGVDLARYEWLAGRSLDRQRLDDLQKAGLVRMRGNSRLQATAKGMLLLDWVISELALEPADAS